MQAMVTIHRDCCGDRCQQLNTGMLMKIVVSSCIKFSRFILPLLLATSLWCCSVLDEGYAPVTSMERVPKGGTHKVVAGETLYSIAWRYGFDYLDLAKRNGLSRPYLVKTGEIIYLSGASSRIVKTRRPILSQPVVPKLPPVVQNKQLTEKEPTGEVNYWQWPARGGVVGNYSASNKGINIAGKLNDPVYATAAGKVVYCGNGLRDYGNLIIIKHNSKFLTAYAHSNEVFVHEGEWVKSGQVIAMMGNTGRTTQLKQAILHFEIRRGGQPVNPMNYLVAS
jgi:lipoprotein NlpD